MTTKEALLAYDLYWLRYKKPGERWYELTDYVREKLRGDGHTVEYDDRRHDVLFDGKSVRAMIERESGKNIQ